MRIDQFVHTLNYGDAISGEALAIQRILRAMSIESEIYSVHAHEKVEDIARDWQEFKADRSTTTEPVSVLLHYSIASPLNQLFLELEGISKGVIYHNLTPVHWFTNYNARVAEDLVKGREELPQLLSQVELVLADSSYNLEELTQLGCSEGKVLPLPLDQSKWSVRANRGIARNIRSQGEKNILHVGRIAPNKRIEDIIKAFYFYHHKIEEKSRLWLVGMDIDTEIYSFELRRLVAELRLKEAVQFVGSVSDGELRAFYENSDLYLCMSEHEGFCVPLLEAMHFGLPVVAYDACAVSETLGEGGLLLAKKSPAEVAELMNIIISDNELSADLVKRGRSQVAKFSEAAFAKALNDTVVEPLRAQAQSVRALG